MGAYDDAACLLDVFFQAEYSEPCGQCGVVEWGVSDGGQFFCKNCHNVIEVGR